LPEVELRARLPQGFRAGASKAGIKASGKPDLAVVVIDGEPAAVAGTFTTNRIPAAPVILDRRHLAATSPDGQPRHGYVQVLLSTSGCANAATGSAGLAEQERLAAAVAHAVGTSIERTLAVATGMIGTRLPIDRIEPAIAALVRDGLRADDQAFADVGEAMRTTDSRAKSASVTLALTGTNGEPVTVVVSGVAKGVGMIHPRMATMLSFVLTDAAAEPAALSAILRPVVARTWNQITVDGDTSTNDTVLLVASGASGAAAVQPGTPEFEALSSAVEAVARSLARQQAADGEGATTLITCQVSGARDDADARAVARAVVGSSLVKAAVHGRDPNWGRIAGAAGNAHLAGAPTLEGAGLSAAEAASRGGTPVELNVDRLRISICGVPVFDGMPIDFDRQAVREAMAADEVILEVDLDAGTGSGEAFGCDLTEEYVIENSEYST
jgi:glutamate N-acetyltransferase/amino-acid N-acetyltransferase